MPTGQCISPYADKRVVLPLLLQNLTFSCLRSRDDDPATVCMAHEINVYTYDDDDDDDNNNNNNSLFIVGLKNIYYNKLSKM